MTRTLGLALVLLLALALPAGAQVQPGPYGGLQFSATAGEADPYGLDVPCVVFCADAEAVGISGTMTGATLGYAFERQEGTWAIEVQYFAGEVGGAGNGGPADCGTTDTCHAAVHDLTLLRLLAIPADTGTPQVFFAAGLAGASYQGDISGACPGPEFCGEGFAWGGALGVGAVGPISNSMFWRAELQWTWLPIGGRISDGFTAVEDFGYWLNLTHLQIGVFWQF